jgi:plastocyanin
MPIVPAIPPSARSLLASLLLAPLAACTVGDITGAGGGAGDDVEDDPGVAPDAAPPPDFAVTLAPARLETTLATESTFTLTLTSERFTGPVSLAATGVPEGYTARFAPTAVTLPVDGVATVELIVAVPAGASGAAATIGVEATAAPGLRQASAELEVAPVFVLDLPTGTGTGAHPFAPTLELKLGTTLRIRNLDATGHRIHSDGGPGFPHQPATMVQGQEYVVTPGDVGNYRYYCHDHGEGRGVTRLTVVP